MPKPYEEAGSTGVYVLNFCPSIMSISSFGPCQTRQPSIMGISCTGSVDYTQTKPRIRGISSAGLCQGWATVPPNPSHAHQLRWFLPGRPCQPTRASRSITCSAGSCQTWATTTFDARVKSIRRSRRRNPNPSNFSLPLSGKIGCQATLLYFGDIPLETWCLRRKGRGSRQDAE